jgi:hypothetical protein
MFINKICIKIKDLKNNFTLLSKVNKIILKNIINQQGGTIDMNDINYSFLNLLKQKKLLKEYNENIKKLNDQFRPMYEILNKTYPNIVVFLNTLTNILGYKNTYTNTNTYKQIIKDDLPDLQNLIYKLIEKSNLNPEEYEKFKKIIDDDELTASFLITDEKVVMAHTTRLADDTVFQKSYIQNLVERKRQEAEKRQRLLQTVTDKEETIQEVAKKALEEKRKEEAKRIEEQRQKLARDQKEKEFKEKLEKKKTEEEEEQAQLKRERERERDTELQITIGLETERYIEEMIDASLRHTEKELLKGQVIDELIKIINAINSIFKNGFSNIGIFVKTPVQSPSNDEIDAAYQILKNSFEIEDYYKSGSSFLDHLYASINYVIYDKYYKEEKNTARNQFLSNMKEKPLINIISTIFYNMHTGLSNKYNALKKAYIEYKNYSMDDNRRFKDSEQRLDANIKAEEYVEYKREINNILFPRIKRYKTLNEKNDEQIKIYQKINEMNTENKPLQIQKSELEISKMINELDIVEKIIFLDNRVKEILFFIVLLTICAFRIKKEDLVNVIRNQTYIDTLPQNVKMEIDNDQYRKKRYWIMWINCVIYTYGCNRGECSIYKNRF